MTRVPSLRELFSRLAGESADPHAALEAAGYGGLEPHLVDEAIVNYAHGAPVEVAEHLSPFVVSHSGVPQGDEGVVVPDTADGLARLSGAPVGTDLPPDRLEADHDTHHDGHGVDHLDAAYTSALSLRPGPSEHGLSEHGLSEHGPEAGSDTGPGHTDLSFGAGERGPDDQVTRADADHGPGDADTDHAVLPGTPAQEPGWLDVTGVDGQPTFDVQHDDWTQGHHDHLQESDPGHPDLDDDHHDPGEVLGGGAGA
jgi:hypothetical protein